MSFSTILVPHDFSPTADRALEVAKALARATDAKKLVLAHAHFVPLEIGALAVQGVERVYADIERQATERLEQIGTSLRDEGFNAEFVALQGAPEHVILEVVADKKADLIVMGTHARHGLRHLFLGSIAERVLRTAPCPVLTVPPHE